MVVVVNINGGWWVMGAERLGSRTERLLLRSYELGEENC